MNIRLLIILLYAIILITLGCNKIEPPFTETTAVKGIDTVKFDDNAVAIKRILLEDFTGHTCGNCPAAAIIANDLLNQYPEQIVVMGLHVSEQFAAPLNDGTGEFTYDFRTSAGTEIDNYFGASSAGLPKGMVDRRNFNGTNVLDRNEWTSAVASILAEDPALEIQVKAYLTSSSDSIVAYVQSKFLNEISGEYKLCVFAIEDSIINWQKDYSIPPPGQKEIEFYVHRHVLRGAFVGAFGESLGNKTFATNEIIKNGYQLKRGSDWSNKNIRVVAFVYRSDTEEIVQTAEAELIVLD